MTGCYYEVRQILQNMTLLPIVTVTTKWDVTKLVCRLKTYVNRKGKKIYMPNLIKFTFTTILVLKKCRTKKKKLKKGTSGFFQ